MKRQFYLFFISILTVILFFSVQTMLSIHKFDDYAVKENIEYLSSDDFKGRLAGTLENVMTQTYVKNQFIKNNLQPYYSNYLDPFEVNYPKRVEGSPYLKITDNKGNVIKEYIYGTDYKEDMLNFRNNIINDSDEQKSFFAGNVAQIVDGNNQFIFFVPTDWKANFRSSFMDNSSFNMYIMVTSRTLNEIKNYTENGCKVKCFIPFQSKKTTLYNVEGVIKGKNTSAPPIILSAHFDHVGNDLKNTTYNGALDNASGISFIIEMSKYISSLGKPDRNIIFVGFNAEELGCKGSEAFVSKYKNDLVGSKVLNFDMIGSNNSVPLSIMGGKKDSKYTKFIQDTANICSNNNIDIDMLFQDSSDHEAFRKNDIDAITLSDNDLSRIHTPDDKAAFISTSSIDRCFKLTSAEVKKYAYSSNLFVNYYKYLSVFSFSALIIIYYYIVLLKSKKQN